MKRILLCLLLWSVCSLSVAAQIQARPLVTQSVDLSRLVTLHGTVHPLAQPGNDLGPVSESTSADRMLLLLNRPPEREAAFQQVLKELNTPGSPSYHHWLTPQQIGEQFGPAATDVDQVAGWLRSSGFKVNGVSKSQRFIEFSGYVGQVNAAFHTQVHEYLVNGKLHHANAIEMRIPQALASIVSTVSPVNDFHPTPQFQSPREGHYDAGARQFVPEFNLSSDWSPLLYGVAPADFQTEYNLAPLYAANVTGAGVTIGIIDASNIDVAVANAYRSVFGLKANPVQVVLDGGDPGKDSSITESYLDVELAGAVAPSATVNLYVSAASPYQDPIELAALRAIEDNQADVLSLSWGSGEAELGASGNQFWNALWEQAAAQGQTVLVAAGDYGQVPDYNYFFSGLFLGPAVSGLASTPWNIAVGGTDFYYSDYAAGAPSASTFWNSANDPVTKGSLKARLPEQVWNDAFGLDAISNGLQRHEDYAGGGGASGCVTVDPNNACTGGYAKPAWQTGPGVPADGVRDIPDVSLFASNGANYSGIVICGNEGSCTPDASGNFGLTITGGTSASAPAMAGIMALVVQKYGRQGQAAATLYPLAQQKPSAFNDITEGGNWDICIQGDAECTLNVAGLGQYAGESTVYSATPGFDLASGLGSIDAANLVNNWNTITFKSTSTSLQVSPQAITHGSVVSISTQVSAVSGSGTPTGAVAILTSSSLPSNESQTVIALNNGSGSMPLNYLPGGTYQLTAKYGGDGVFSSSTSAPQTLTVSPEKTTLALAVQGLYGTSASNLTYGLPVNLSAQPVSVNSPKSDGAATGTVNFTLDGTTAAMPLNVGGIASWNAPVLSVGMHTAGASYGGDSSFLASSATVPPFSIAKGFPYVNIYIDSPVSSYNSGWTVNPGSSITITAEVGPEVGILSGGVTPVGTAGPTGTVTICLNTSFNVGVQACTGSPSAYTQTVPLVPASGRNSLYSTATATFTNVAANGYMAEFVYSGDANWRLYGLDLLNYIIVQSSSNQVPSATVNLAVSPTNIAGMQVAQLTATVSGSAGAAPTGEVDFYDGGIPVAYTLLPAATSTTASTVSVGVSPSSLWTSGANQITALYLGDKTYAPSSSNAVTLNATQTAGVDDFTIVPVAPQLNVSSGSSGNLALNLTSINGFNNAIAITCAPSSSQFSCSVSPGSAPLSGTASATLLVSAILPGSAANHAPTVPKALCWIGEGAIAFCILLVLPPRRRRHGIWMSLVCLPVLFATLFMTSCGGSGGGGGTAQPPANGTPTGTYSVVLTATANGIIHTAKVTVLVK